MICSNELISRNDNISSNPCCDKKNKTCRKRAGCSFAISPRAIPAVVVVVVCAFLWLWFGNHSARSIGLVIITLDSQPQYEE